MKSILSPTTLLALSLSRCCLQQSATAFTPTKFVKHTRMITTTTSTTTSTTTTTSTAGTNAGTSNLCFPRHRHRHRHRPGRPTTLGAGLQNNRNAVASSVLPKYRLNQVMMHMSSSSSSSSAQPPQITSIDKSQMNEIIQTVEDGEQQQQQQQQYVIIDVRNVDEINYTGKLSPAVQTLPLPYIVQYGIFKLDDDEFEENFAFPKPALDQTLVFTCKAGIRSMHAAQFAIQAGYTDVINYSGGADEWFR
jgi:rhodanese-related sulfurtransferase